MNFFKFMISTVLVFSLFLVGCSSSNDQPEQPTESETTNEGSNTNNEEQALGGDEVIKETLEANKDVDSAMVQIDKTGETQFVNVDIIVSSDDEPEAKAETYAEQIKDKYPDHTIDIMIIHDDQVIYQNKFE